MAPRTRATRTPVEIVAAVVGVVFLLVGIAGFLPGITTHYDALSFAGHDSAAKLLGVFQVSVLHNLIHLAFGVAGLAMSRTISGARSYLIGGGIVYAVVWIYGLIVSQGSAANFVPLNTADNWLHFILAVGMVALGLALGGRAARRSV
jgi:hypothetical protein